MHVNIKRAALEKERDMGWRDEEETWGVNVAEVQACA